MAGATSAAKPTIAKIEERDFMIASFARQFAGMARAKAEVLIGK